MRKCQAWTLGLLLLLGACASSADAPRGIAVQAPPAVPTANNGTSALAGDDVLAGGSGAELTALDPAAGPESSGVLTPIASSAAATDFDQAFDELKRDAAPPAPAAPAILPDRRAAAAVVAARPPGTAVGYLLVDLATGQDLAELNPDLPLIPASTVKLATAVVALDVLGPEHRFRTELLVDGRVERGVLRGDL